MKPLQKLMRKATPDIWGDWFTGPPSYEVVLRDSIHAPVFEGVDAAPLDFGVQLRIFNKNYAAEDFGAFIKNARAGVFVSADGVRAKMAYNTFDNRTCLKPDIDKALNENDKVIFFSTNGPLEVEWKNVRHLFDAIPSSIKRRGRSGEMPIYWYNKPLNTVAYSTQFLSIVKTFLEEATPDRKQVLPEWLRHVFLVSNSETRLQFITTITGRAHRKELISKIDNTIRAWSQYMYDYHRGLAKR